MFSDDRGLAYALFRAMLIVVVVAAMGALLNPAFEDVENDAANRSDGPYKSEIDTGQTWMGQAWDLLPLFTLLLVVVVVGAAAAREGRI